MSRRQQILDTAAVEFARRGFHGASISDLGRACGISGPALYKHFASKPAILAEMLVSISDELLRVGRERAEEAASDRDALVALVDWHISFALEHPALIVVQDRDWDSLPEESRERVRKTQLQYVDLWARVICAVRPGTSTKQARAAVHACFGLLNSTPRSALLPAPQMREMLSAMALAAVTAD